MADGDRFCGLFPLIVTDASGLLLTIVGSRPELVACYWTVVLILLDPVYHLFALQICSHTGFPVSDPDRRDEVDCGRALREVQEYIRQQLPGVEAGTPAIQEKCMYTVSGVQSEASLEQQHQWLRSTWRHWISGAQRLH